MSLLVIPFPDIDPVAIAFGPVSIKWYGLAYLIGLLIGWLYVKHLLNDAKLWAPGAAPFAAAKVDDLLLYLTLGVVLGGRLGYVFLYEPSTYLAHPLEILAVWKGGMSFHGALVGCGLATWLFARHNGVSPFTTMDLASAAVPIGLFFGRLANFINGELFGRVTDVPWAMVFPQAKLIYPSVEPQPRHPSQLYEAALEGIVLFVVLRLLTHRFGALKSPGAVTGAFLIGYGIARSTVELAREPHFYVGPLTAGQIYSLPMVALGLLFLWRARAAPEARPAA
ncbi:MAG: prolipoprotein diacylglyceryl transferase [Hyphomicrobium sp.]|jgi:phosphatidylglycerol:prolipoprotein diacylglycerol transferase